jgi:formylglycine-generating enzyme required for sulfatase activity
MCLRAVLALLLAFPLTGCKVGSSTDGGGGGDDDGGTGGADANTDPTSCLDAGPGGTAGMILIPGGTFQMGCDTEDQCQPESRPKHTVTVCPYEIDRTEVSQIAYNDCLTAGMCALPFASFQPTSDSPVAWATWDMAHAYCTFVGKRLPTEAEWELAARGTQGFLYPWGTTTLDCTLANATSCQDTLEPVDSYPQGASPFGLVHMIGNVSEWVNDFYGPYTSQAIVDPQGPPSGDFRIHRGGGFSYPGALVLSTFWRENREQDAEIDHIGFRCAK